MRGCIIQDMGYYPFGSKFFSDLVHYVRTGDFVLNLIREAQTLNELAFALGALAHYAADTQGHSVAVNRSVPLEYPKLAKKYGKVVTYADDKTSHLKVEFSFDVVQVARGNYAPQSYHDFIGFQVEKAVLERAFRDTYSLELKDIFGDLDLALGTYRHAVSSVIPELTRVAWHMKKEELATGRPRRLASASSSTISRGRAIARSGTRSTRSLGSARASWRFSFGFCPRSGHSRRCRSSRRRRKPRALFETSFDRTLDEYRRLLTDESARPP